MYSKEIRILRLEKARKMLIKKENSLWQIAEQCGFSSVYHFCRMFKQRTGLTPTQYAANNKVYKI